MASVTEREPHGRQQSRKAAASGWIGSALEYYDFFIYATAAAVFLPLASYVPAEQFYTWGWRIPFLLSAVVLLAGYIIRREVDEMPAFAEEAAHGGVPRSPIVQAFQTSGADILRVVCMAR